MAVNFDILQPANIAGNMLAGSQEAQQALLGKQQLETSQIQLENLKRDRDALVKLQQTFVANGKSPNLEENFGAMIQSGIPHFVDIGTQGLQKLQQQKAFASIMGGGGTTSPAASAAAPMPPAPYGALGSGTYDPTAAVAPVAPVNALARTSASPAAPVNALAAPQATGNPLGGNVDALRQQRNAFLSLGTPEAIAAAKALDADIAIASKEPVYHNVPGVGLVDSRTGAVIAASKERQDTDLIRNFNLAQKQGFKGDIFDYERKLKEAGRPPAPPSAPVAVVDPATGKQVLVSREEAISKRLTPAAAQESLPPKEMQKREAAYPQATAAVKSIEANTDNLIQDLQTLRDHPGLNQITGIAAGRLPALTANGRAAQALYDKVVAKGGFQVLQDMRNASKTGGALGNVSNTEGAQLKSAFAAIDRKQDASDVRKAIDEAISNAQGSKARVRDAYDMTYDYRTGNAPAAAPAVTKPGLTVSNW